MQNQEQQLVKLLTANCNAIDITITDEGVRVTTLRHPVVSGIGASVLMALIVAAARKKRYVQKNVGFMDTNEAVIQYEYDFGRLEPIEKPTIEGMHALLVKRTLIQVFSRDGQVCILTQNGMQIQGSGDTLFKSLIDIVQKLKTYAKRHDIIYRDILDDIELYEQHYGEIP